VLLDNGQILVPVRDSEASNWRMARIDVEAPEYAEWLVEIQRRGGLARAVSRGLWRFCLQWLVIVVLPVLLVAGVAVLIVGKQNGWW